MNLDPRNEVFEAIPEPVIDRTSRVTIGAGTCGLGKYTTPLLAAAKKSSLRHYIDRKEQERETRLEMRRHEAMMALNGSQQACLAEQRRAAREEYELRRAEEHQKMMDERHRQAEEAALEKEQRREENAKRIEILQTRKREQRVQAQAAKENQRRSRIHEMIDRKDRERLEGLAVWQEREWMRERNQAKAVHQRELALASKQAAAEAVKKMKAEQREEADKAKAEIDRKLRDRRAEFDDERRQQNESNASQRQKHKEKLNSNAEKLMIEKLQAVHDSRLENAVPTAAAIKRSREDIHRRYKVTAHETRRAATSMW